MPVSVFDQLEQSFATGGAAAALEELARRLQAEKRYRELFTARQMQVRHRLGLPIIDRPGAWTDLDEPLRDLLEEGYVEACREVGKLILAEGRFREAWMYLQISGDRQALRDAMAQRQPTEDNVSEMIEVALYEGVAPVLGVQLVLNHHGTCNTITTLDGQLNSFSRADQQAAAGIMVRHLHGELLANVRTDIARQQASAPQETTLAELVGQRDWLFANDNYHVDTSHLSSVVRFARVIEDDEDLRLAIDLTEYGRRLSPQFQYDAEEPFAEYYPSHNLFFRAMRDAALGIASGEATEQAVAYFRQRAEQADIEEDGTAAVEFYIALLYRVGRPEEAIEASLALLPTGVQTFGYAPDLVELADRAGRYDRLMEISRQRGDLVGFTAGLLGAARGNAPDAAS